MDERSSMVTRPPRAPWWARLFESVDIASLVCFRIAFGVLMLAEVFRYLPRVSRYYIEPEFHFTYFGFDWVQPLPGEWMYVHFGVLGLAALFITIGLFYRVSASVFFLGLSYVFLVEQARYLNHIYLLCLISFIMIFVPAHRALSVDAWLRPKLRSQTAPAWALWLVRFQIGVPYFFGGVAKINADWLQGEPLRMWLAHRADHPLYGSLMTEEWVVYFFSYAGLVFDLLIVPAMLWRKTRVPAFLAALCFHFINGNIFTIGIFPWVMAAATLIYFPPDWPRQVGRRFLKLVGVQTIADPPLPPPPPPPPPTTLGPRRALLLGVLGTYVAWQMLMPLRHWLYPGDVAWTEEGHKFAWRMKLRDKRGSVVFVATDPASGRTWRINPRKHLARWQVGEMTGRPEMILQFAHHIADKLRDKGYPDVEVRAIAAISLNGRPPRLMIDPDVDLTRVERSIWPASWILRDPPPLEPSILPQKPAKAPEEAAGANVTEL
ncbi:MAG TPA: HTTM domain-containing protein [Nannocystis sp.]